MALNEMLLQYILRDMNVFTLHDNQVLLKFHSKLHMCMKLVMAWEEKPNGFIIWGPWMSVGNCVQLHQEAVFSRDKLNLNLCVVRGEKPVGHQSQCDLSHGDHEYLYKTQRQSIQ